MGGQRWERRQPEGIGGYSSLEHYNFGYSDGIAGRDRNPRDYTSEYEEGWLDGFKDNGRKIRMAIKRLDK